MRVDFGKETSGQFTRGDIRIDDVGTRVVFWHAEGLVIPLTATFKGDSCAREAYFYLVCAGLVRVSFPHTEHVDGSIFRFPSAFPEEGIAGILGGSQANA